LAKEPEKRYQSIKDVAIELDELRQELKGNGEPEASVQPQSNILEAPGSPKQTKIEGAQQSTASGGETESLHPISSAEYSVSGIRRHGRGLAIALTAFILILAVLGYGVYLYSGRGVEKKENNISFQSAKFTRLTSTGKARRQVCRARNGGRRAAKSLDQTNRDDQQRSDCSAIRCYIPRARFFAGRQLCLLFRDRKR
jgi:hypothetical protein